MAFAALFAVLPWWAILAGWTGSDGLEASHDWVMWLVAFLSPLALLAGLAIAWVMLSPAGHAIRISDGRLFYPGALRGGVRIRSMPLADITSFSIGTHSDSGAAELVGFAFLIAALFSHETPQAAGARSTKGIFAHIKDGRTVHIQARLMDEPRDVILTRLNQALADSRR